MVGLFVAYKGSGSCTISVDLAEFPYAVTQLMETPPRVGFRKTNDVHRNCCNEDELSKE